MGSDDVDQVVAGLGGQPLVHDHDGVARSPRILQRADQFGTGGQVECEKSGHDPMLARRPILPANSRPEPKRLRSVP